ncbi:MAG: UGMP family protein [Candidatus Micrarchaeota archaeon]|nr:UGMP family protein [Candidatus Micrarchaeota archaeon]MCX8154414.1 UGMP family protein [Candidatus Micrarchaeota archaeon]
MIVLGIESTAHTLGIAIKRDRDIINLIDTYQGEYIPRDLAEHHAKVFLKLLREALQKASIEMSEIELISVSQGPGIGAPLSFGIGMANYISSKLKIPLIGVNHGYAHIEIVEYMNGKRGDLALYISGGNTMIVRREDLKIIGETLDMGIGNMLDKAARELGLRGAADLERLALQRDKYIEFPYTVKGMNTTFAGIYTYFVNSIKKNLGTKENLSYSLFHTSFSMLLETLARAVFAYRAKSVVVCGGVAQSKILNVMLDSFSEQYGIEILRTENQYNRDNAAMIAVLGERLYNEGYRSEFPLKSIPRYRVSDSMKHYIRL